MKLLSQSPNKLIYQITESTMISHPLQISTPFSRPQPESPFISQPLQGLDQDCQSPLNPLKGLKGSFNPLNKGQFQRISKVFKGFLYTNFFHLKMHSNVYWIQNE
ncbi:unnamed protein product [Meganyctiphanes norvegica]|uniref:Uncharacterized protein n=1 Tax=Meganyctiphanes norvegica TaxID=48144 RepID=A0AAV2RTN3_MEGNR